MTLGQSVKAKKDNLLALVTDMGPGFLVAVGFIDPGNIATNVVAGANYGYQLLWVVVLSTLMVILMQEMAARLGVASHRCLSEAIATQFGRGWSLLLAPLVLIGSVATVMAELLGAALGLHLLFGIPLWLGGALTALAAAIIIWRGQYHHVEDIIVGFVGIIGLCYLIELFIATPDWGQVLRSSLIPHLSTNNTLLAVGILGAILMPSNLYLHSSIVQEKDWSEAKLHHEFIDTTVSMIVGGFINAAIIIVAAAIFFSQGHAVRDIADAAITLTPLAGELAHYLFALALFFAGFASSITGAMAGSYGIGGFVFGTQHHSDKPFRLGFIAILAMALIIVCLGLDPLGVLVISQAVLGVLLPFTVIPLLLLMRRRSLVGSYINRAAFHYLGWGTAIAAVAMDVILLMSLLSP